MRLPLLVALAASTLVGCGSIQDLAGSAVDAAAARFEAAIPRLVESAASRAEEAVEARLLPAVEKLPEIAEAIATDVARRVAPPDADDGTVGAYETAIGSIVLLAFGGVAQWIRNRWSNEKKAETARVSDETRKRVEELAQTTARLEGRVGAPKPGEST